MRSSDRGLHGKHGLNKAYCLLTCGSSPKISPVNFNEAESYLLSLGNEVATMKLGLDAIRRLLAELGNPQERYRKVQVAGTNGKGSVCAFLNSICLRAGITTGLYTSPHLVSMTERVKIDGADIKEIDFACLATRVRKTVESLVASGELESIPTYFEQVTAIALLAFAEANVELAILETGLGGRLDATTAANAEIAAITRIDLDHQQYLGETIEEIAAEKAAIIHAGSLVIAVPQTTAVEQVIDGRCREVGAELAWATTNILVKSERDVRPSLIATFVTDHSSYGNVLLWNMLGHHQIENASVAIGIAELLTDIGFEIDSRSVELGLEAASHPGRLEWIGRFLLDGAHNLGGAKALRSFLDEFVERPVTMIFGAMDDKDVLEISGILFPVAHSVILTRPDNPRAIPPEDLREMLATPFTECPIDVTNSVAEAIKRAGELPDDHLVLVTGSLYLVGEARRILTQSELRV